ncbi:MAG: hypothetical protein ACXAC7_04610 [Candidatus Hodarchaeales archaeon]|jgi:hypothetical protein
MELIKIVALVITGLFFFSTAVCGLWMYSMSASGEIVDNSSKIFHMVIAFLSLISSMATMFLLSN